jgi:hypothetical protein
LVFLLADGPFQFSARLLTAAIIASQGPLAAWVSRQLGKGSADQRQSTRLIVLGLCIWPAWTAMSFFTSLVAGQNLSNHTEANWAYGLLCLSFIWPSARLLRSTDGQRHWGAPTVIGLFAAAGVANGFFSERLGRPTYFATIVGLALVVAYGILRRDLFTLDRKVHLALSKSTVAAVFLAVLFIVANIAQNYLGGKFGVVVGGAAAGMLFFVIAPIQRVAERLAEKAVPVTAGATVVDRPGAPNASQRAEQAYRAVLKRYLRDGVVSRDEERTLAHVAGELRIDAGRAFELREQAEREAC